MTRKIVSSVNPYEPVFLNALNEALHGSRRATRNGITRAIFARQMRFKDIYKRFPAVTTKFLAFEVVKAETLWFLDAGRETGGRLSLAKLNEFLGKPAEARNIWTHDQKRFADNGKAKFVGDCGRIYGAQWRSFAKPVFVEGHNQGTEWVPDHYNITRIDQIAKVMKQLKEDPFSRYHVVTAWNPAEIEDMCLPPCHMKFQLFVRPTKRKDGKMFLDLSMDQRSCDMFLGVPFNIAGYALLLSMMAHCLDMLAGELIITLEDCHVYIADLGKDGKGPNYKRGHAKQVRQQLSNTPLRGPRLWLNPKVKDIDSFTMNDIRLDGYRHQGKISAEML